MSSKVQCLALVTAAGLCAPAFAQDSVSNSGAGLPGDALSPYALDQQCAEYVADLVEFQTSKGTTFGIVPILKSPKTSTSFFNNLISAQSISPDILTDVASASGNYDLWTVPGQGIHPTNNNAPGTLNGPASSAQFAVGFADFGGNYNGVVGAVVNVDPATPARLFVTRRQSVTNGNSISDNFAQTGYGAVDANGNQYYRADDFGTSGGSLSGNNLFRTRLLDRTCNMLNLIDGNLANSDAADAFDTGFAGVLVAPNMGPASIFGGNGIVATATFDSEYAYGTGGATTKTTSALGGDATKGALGYSSYNLLGGAGVATYGQLNTELPDPADAAVFINIWEVDATGAPIANLNFAPPAAITDNATGVTVTGGAWQFGNFLSQAAFRGGAGQVALTQDPATGLTLIAAERDFAGAPDIANLPLNDITVIRYNPATGGTEYALAAYIDPTNTIGGKGICDENGMFIGRLEELFDVTGGTPVGPSISSPAFDSAGNIWFLSSAGLFDTPVADSTTGNVVDFDTILIRAVYDSATFSYTLEKVLEPGDLFVGANSGTPYVISFLGLADSNSISSGAFFSGNVSEEAFAGTAAGSFDPADPRTNGGVVVNAQITYDVDGDGDFEDPTAGNPGIDEEYQALLFIGNTTPAGAFCDCDNNGVLNVDDIDCFVSGFLGGDLATADCDGNGSLNVDDIDCFVSCFLAGL
ncbi:MAG: hypothetical protein DHS20C14_16820 [Phycisphaeraceae bacterium]|nr:MAG: hypothetical protein DHS20C14_16820 [Phycisphaeraceae bacterium]